MAFTDDEKRRCSGMLTSLALRLTKQLAGGEKRNAAGDKNLVFSPLSVYAALGLVAAGARGAALDELLALLVGGASSSSSRDELAAFVRAVAERAFADHSTSGGGGPVVSFASGVWYDVDKVALKPDFLAAAAGSYKAATRAVDFAGGGGEEAREEINRWASQATRGLIADVIPPGAVDDLTRLVLVNAVYFKGKWERPFASRRTKKDKFFLLGGGAVDTPLMRGSGTHLIAVHDGFKVLKLPYQQAPPLGDRRRRGPPDPNAEYSMWVFLPDARDGLWSLVDEIASSVNFLRIHLPKRKVNVRDFRLPKFKMSFSGELTGVLRELGLEATLDPEPLRAPDLSDMAESAAPLSIDCVHHRAVIEVNEEGTEAAAVTGMYAMAATAPPQTRRETVDFVADHPFAFFVMEEVSGAVVFAGCVLDPSQTQ
ncbi:hypothetical protein HU200_015149 [Digitaria exilis]|uniref:Serpin domain-containing protein n=1 Tax=Digitaria exilis TaxID=1010633 RepID=A0A835KJD0_9POAL|nr:hypothetical protein HU200_015149 [Digitaria exilis]CAB3469424.1 unnamed protein product [Digitaria exilis]